MFTAATTEHIVEEQNNIYTVPYTDEVLTNRGWIKVKSLVVGDIICGDDSKDIIREIKRDAQNDYLLVV